VTQDPAAFEKQVLKSDKRFEIFVPKPKTRINMGKPAGSKQPDGPFGHEGLTVSTEKNIFVQAAEHSVYQVGKDANFLVGGKESHFVSKDLEITSGGDMRLSAKQRVLVISGADNAPTGRADHGALRLQAYNNLAQHYRVDSIEVGLFEFFHGRRDRPRRPPGMLAKAFGKAKKDVGGNWLLTAKRKHFDHTDPIFVELAKDPELQGGFTQNLLRTMTALYPSELSGIGDKGEVFFPPNLAHYPNTRSAAEKDTKIPARKGLFARPQKLIPAIIPIKDPSDPRYWIEPLFEHEAEAAGAGHKGQANAIFGVDDVLELEFGFSRYYARFDPYKCWKPEAFGGGPAKAMVTLKNGLIRLRRRLDCLFHAVGFPSAIAQLITQGVGAVPVVGPILGALFGAVDAFNTVAEAVDQYRDAAKDGRANPFEEPALAFAKPFDTKADERKASVKSKDGPWDLSTGTAPWAIEVKNEAGSVVTYTLSTAAVPPRPAVLSFVPAVLYEKLEKGVVVGKETVDLTLEIDGQRFALAFDPTNSANAAAVAAVLTPALAQLASVAVSNDAVTITTHSTGPSARILVQSYADDKEDAERWPLTTGWLENGIGQVPPIADLSAVTAADIASRLVPVNGVVISDVNGAVRFTSEKVGNGSKIEVSGNLADKIFGTEKKIDHVTPQISPDWEEIDSAGAIVLPIKTWVEWVQKLPEKTQELMRPLTDACSDLLNVLEGLETVAEGVLGVAAANVEIPEPPESVGIFGTQGITLGTNDRIVGSGGAGILFVVDGGSGEPDKGKMAGKLELAARFAGGFTPPLRKVKKQSLGFRVFSDSLIDLSAAQGAQLLAMGRGKTKDNRAHGDKIGGVGVARVLSSWVTEIGGHDKVIISARGKGDPSDKDALTGGRIEVAAQTIAIGGVRNETKDGEGNEYGPYDWDETRTGLEAHTKSFGITPLELETVAMSEHLTLSKEKNPPPPVAPHIKKMAKYAWPKVLRKEHPRTERVHVHSGKEALIVVGPYMVQVTSKEGIHIGLRKANKDPSVNEVDDKKPRFWVDDASVRFLVPNKDKSEHAGVTVFSGQTIVKGTDGSGDAGLVSLSEGSITMSAGSKDEIELTKTDGMKVTVSKIDLTGSGPVKIKGGQVQIG
jgi:hypothetical protein